MKHPEATKIIDMIDELLRKHRAAIAADTALSKRSSKLWGEYEEQRLLIRSELVALDGAKKEEP